ncbi:MAG TPA: hypothetical protein VMM93_11265 [Vicinamibacterales bacterium]|nr:hypothetical protein [Vicinamibacterales bacterium]
MRLADTLLRRGHLAESALLEALLAGNRPAHLDQCDLCAGRAAGLNRWLDDVSQTGLETADDIFTAERLAGQQAQVLRRLAQLDQPKRVIAFPAPRRGETNSQDGRRVAAGWVGVAAAAGLVLGLIGGQVTARLAGSSQSAADRAAVATSPPPATGTSFFDFDIENSSLRGTPAGVLDEMTPRAIDTIVSTRVGG